MEQVASILISAMPNTALPLVVVVLGVAFIYIKFGKKCIDSVSDVQKDRKITKKIRDDDSQNIHDQLLKHEFQLCNLKGVVELHSDKLDQIQKQLNEVNVNLAVIAQKLDNVCEAVKDKK